jgi:hypothetical protein
MLPIGPSVSWVRTVGLVFLLRHWGGQCSLYYAMHTIDSQIELGYFEQLVGFFL